MEPDESQEIAVPDAYLDTVEIHGRLFQKHALQHKIYFAPVDEEEAQRLQLFHHVFHILFDKRLIFPGPIPSPRRILDCGFGSATWAIEVADSHPRCEVIGVDIASQMSPPDLPPNLYLEVDDLNQRLNFDPSYFDIVHSRCVAGGIDADRWGDYTKELNRVLIPGGWCQMVEVYFNAQSNNGTLTDGHGLRRWSQLYLQSIQPEKNGRVGLRLEELMRSAGFENVEARMMQLPLCAWPEDAREKEVGAANRENMSHLLSSLAIYPFTERLGMSINEVQVLLAQARRDAQDPSLKAYFPVYVCIGQKKR
ncbi:hypothetical protein KVR01_003004 [Diaporthe batatas]|uniref:uncharacterized protein n=1 Tax=Diaporthe batatas TaxID=748121 RepID=UPI001D04F46D|nr:uncharacterized protein KVR01_003004 [Diaporthe batatas]KAG8167315.1 hypothetical protein KVR01_003004 [Diaporthe batatas]